VSTVATYCTHSGVIGGTGTYRPVEPWERGWGHPSALVLCSNLICRCCSTAVRSVANHALRPRPDEQADDPRVRPIDFAGRPIDLVKALDLEVDEAARTFACACRAISTRAGYQLAYPAGAARTVIPWVCKGHPAPTLTSELDGEPLPIDAGGWLGVCQKALGGEWPTHHRGRDVHDREHPAFRLAHILVHIHDVKLQAALGRRVASWGLLHADAKIRHASVDLYGLLPRFPGYEALGDALTRHRTLFDDIVLDDDAQTSLGAVLRATIAIQLKTGPVEPLSGAVRMDLLAGFGCTALVQAVVRDTPTWVIERLLGIIAHDPVRRRTVREAMEAQHPGLMVALNRELAAF